MAKITADLIYKCPQYFNPIRERELDLRGNKIAVIENLGATEDQFDCIDLSDNEIVKLENFPYMKRLSTLLINNNRIARVNPNVGEFLPNLHTLVLTNNRIVNLVDLDPLASFPKLKTLSLLDNLVTKKQNYRLYVINKLKNLRLLDFRKVMQKEKMEAERLFASKEAEEVARKVPAETFTPGEVPIEELPNEEKTPKKAAPTPEQILAIKAAIANSQTLEEVARLEKALKSGQLPEDLNITNDDMKMDPVEHSDNERDFKNRDIPSENAVVNNAAEENDHDADNSVEMTDNVGKVQNPPDTSNANSDATMENANDQSVEAESNAMEE